MGLEGGGNHCDQRVASYALHKSKPTTRPFKTVTCGTRPAASPLHPPPRAGFVSDNARRLLALDAPSVLPVSGRAALRAKLECGSAVRQGAMDTVADDLLQDHPAWKDSRRGAWVWIWVWVWVCVFLRGVFWL